MKMVRDNILCNNITFIDGLTGSGKSLIAPFVSSFSNAELWRLNHLYEYILILLDLNKISFDGASVLLKLYADLDLYNLRISRDINFRNNDDSSPHNNLLNDTYLARLKINDGDKEVKKILENNPSLIIMSHFIAQKTPLIEKIYDDRNWLMLVVLRSPATVIRKWFESGFFDKHNNDPREFTLTEKTNHNVYPWYARKDKEESYSDIEHIVDFVLNYFLDQENLHSKYKNNYRVIYFEAFENNPILYLSEFKIFFGKFTSTTKKLLGKFDLPRKNFQKRITQSHEDLDFILPLLTNNDLKKELNQICINYENEVMIKLTQKI
jgi:hypothetical protein